MLGSLTTSPAADRPDLLAAPVLAALSAVADAQVVEIDPAVADTAALCAAYDLDLAVSANCVVVSGRRAGQERHAACVVLASTRADVNGVVRRHLDVRKLSFADADFAVSATGMQYGGITPIGLPASWTLLIDSAVAATPLVVVGSGLRRSKLVVAGSALAQLPGAEVVEGLARAKDGPG
jgi:prolyl-tRNA editing enzyme YbaK/EbsC (Cys-tRNA(Pro) deacylase)